MRIEMPAVVQGRTVIGGKQVLHHLDDGAGIAMAAVQTDIAGSDAAAAVLAHGQSSFESIAARAIHAVADRSSGLRSSTRSNRNSSPATMLVRYPPQTEQTRRPGVACDRAPQPRQLTATAVVSTDSTASAAQLPVRMTANAWASKAGSTPDSGPTSMVIRSTAGRTAGGRDVRDLRQQRLADGQLMHAPMLERRDPARMYASVQTFRRTRCSDGPRNTHEDARRCCCSDETGGAGILADEVPDEVNGCSRRRPLPGGAEPLPLVLGFGNVLLSDDGAGVQAVELLRELCGNAANFIDAGTLSFSLLSYIEATDSLLVIDAANLDDVPGTLAMFAGTAMDDFLKSVRRRTVHEVGLIDLLDMARLGECLPSRRALLCIQPGRIDWGENPVGSGRTGAARGGSPGGGAARAVEPRVSRLSDIAVKVELPAPGGGLGARRCRHTHRTGHPARAAGHGTNTGGRSICAACQ